MIMKKETVIYLLALICILCSCGTPSTKEYVIDKVNDDLIQAVRLIYMTNSDNELDLSKCHAVEYFRTLTPPDNFGEMHECVAIRYQEGLLFSVDGSRAVYFFDDEKLKKNYGIFSAIPTKDNYWLPATITSDGSTVAYEAIANETNPLYYTIGLDEQKQKLESMGIAFDPCALPLVKPSK